MPFPWAMRGLRNGVLTSRWPSGPDGYFDSFRAAVTVVRDDTNAAERAELVDQRTLDQICPTGALRTAVGDVAVDRARCILCGRCVASRPTVFAWVPGSSTARLRREQLVVGPVPYDDDALSVVRTELGRRVRRLRRSVHIRHVDTGSDGSDEWEVQALLNPVYDIHRLGIFFTASPRHADILLVTGVGASGMAAPLRRTREAMPDPVVVIAAGADAVSGGLLRDGYSGSHGIGSLLDVDIWVPGSPASPFSVLHAILLGLGRLPVPAPSAAVSGWASR